MKPFGIFHCLVIAILCAAMFAAVVISVRTMAGFALHLRKLSQPTPKPYIVTPQAMRMLI